MAVSTTDAPARPARGRRPASPAAAAVTGCVALLVVVLVWGAQLQRHENLVVGPWPPFVWGPLPTHLPGFGILPAAVLAVILVAGAPIAAQRLRWRTLLAVAWASAAVWAVALAASSGWSRVAAPLDFPDDYRPTLPALRGGELHFLRTFVAALPTYSTHTRGHPPGPVLVVAGLERLGLHGAGWEAAVVIGAGTSAAAAIAVTVRAMAGETAARRVLPYLVLLPAAVWIATSMDALFLGVAAWGIALLAVAARRSDPSGVRLAAAAGLLLGLLPYLSYGLVPIAALAVAAALHRPRVLLVATATALAVAAAFTAAGFWWPDGVAATHVEWAKGAGHGRPYQYFVLADLAVLGVLIGPATVAGLARLRDRRLWLLVGAGLVILVVSDLSGVERGEVERIWLPFAPWLVPATAALPGGRRGRRWLAAQAMLALVTQSVVYTRW